MAHAILRTDPATSVQVLLGSAKGVLQGMGENPALDQAPLHARVMSDLQRIQHAVQLLHATMPQDLRQLMNQHLYIASMQPSCLRHVTVRADGAEEWANTTPRMF